jgi:hypothetical protein
MYEYDDFYKKKFSLPISSFSNLQILISFFLQTLASERKVAWDWHLVYIFAQEGHNESKKLQEAQVNPIGTIGFMKKLFC